MGFSGRARIAALVATVVLLGPGLGATPADGPSEPLTGTRAGRVERDVAPDVAARHRTALVTRPSLRQRSMATESVELRQLEAELLDLLNAARRRHGTPTLRIDPTLGDVARRHSREMAERGVVSHFSRHWGLSSERRVRISYPHVPSLAENVARNGSVQALHEALLRSPGHRANRLDPGFTHVGIGLARATPFLLYVTEVFVEAPGGGDLGPPVARYFDAPPGAYEVEETALVEVGDELFTVGPPGADDPEHWTQLGIDAFLSGDVEAAVRHFRHALAIDPAYHYATYNLARTLLRGGNPQQAAAILDAYLQERPEDVEARASRGVADLLLANWAGAEVAFRRVLAARPGDAGAWYNLGLALEYMDRLDEAENAYLEALEHDVTLQPAHAGLVRLRRR